MIVGLKSLSLDNDTRRKEMYGKAGCFRFTNFGVEYRVLSNFWIATDELLTWAFNSTLEAIELVNSGRIEELSAKYKDKIVEAINTNNKYLANELLEIINEKELQLV